MKEFAACGDQVWFTYNSGKKRAEEILQSLPSGSDAKVCLKPSLVFRGLQDILTGANTYSLHQGQYFGQRMEILGLLSG